VEGTQWDFFLAHAAGDAAAAEELFDGLSPLARVFLDRRCLLPGDDWDQALRAAQVASRITVVLISTRTEEAYYEREEVAAALDLARRDPQAHRVVPVYLDAPDVAAGAVPYGLRLKQGLDASAPGGLGRVAEQLLATLEHLRGTPLTPERREASTRALSRLTSGSTADRLSGFQEVAGVFRPLVNTLLAILALCLLLIGACALAPGVDAAIDRTLALSILGTLCAGVLMSLMFVFLRSVGLAREIARSASSR
jgi:TIR domain